MTTAHAKNIIRTSHIPTISMTPIIEDLACNIINVRATCKGSLQIATIPPQADIYIYEEIYRDYILRTEKTGTMIYPTIINDIECTGPTRSNKFKLTLPGYVDIEGMLDITDGTVYQLYIIMEKCTVKEFGEDFLISALAIGGIILLLFGRDKEKHKLKRHREIASLK